MTSSRTRRGIGIIPAYAGNTEGIERVLAKFDYGGGDQNALTARVASLETLLSNIKSFQSTLSMRRAT